MLQNLYKQSYMEMLKADLTWFGSTAVMEENTGQSLLVAVLRRL